MKSDNADAAKISEQFNFDRFYRYMKFSIDDSMRRTLIGLGIMFIIQTLMLYGILSDTSELQMMPNDSSDTAASILSIFFFGFNVFIVGLIMMTIIYYQASSALKSYNHRATAWTAFLLPVSKREKFAVKYILYTIALPILLGIMYALSVMIAFAAVEGLSVDDAVSITESFGSALIPNYALIGNFNISEKILFSSTFFNAACTILSYFWLNSTICFTCAAIAKHHPFLMSSALIVVIQLFIVHGAATLICGFAGKTPSDSTIFFIHTAILAVYIIVGLALTYTSWHFFSRRHMP